MGRREYVLKQKEIKNEREKKRKKRKRQLTPHTTVDFSETAEDIRFELEGDDQPILRARLRTEDGEWFDADVNLTECIMNRDGQLCFGELT